MIRSRLLAASWVLLFIPAFLRAQESPLAEPDPVGGEDVFILPEVEVSAVRDSPEVITQEEMEREGANDLWEAVQHVPGVILSGGGRRNDSNFTVRGYGADSVPVYVDGVPAANPYRGEGDSARLLTGDLESIEIQKGYSSELLGANTLGGAVLLNTAKPQEPFEASLKTSLGLDSVFQYADSAHVLNLGTRLEYFYGKLVLQYRDVDHFRLPAAFEAVPNNPQDQGDRLWSDSEDLKLTLMAGATPLPALDVWMTYSYQWADKGLSPPDINTREYAIWDWPVWNRHSLALNGVFSQEPFSMQGLFYFDKYDNRLDEYYTLKALDMGIHAPHSDYDEYALGGRLLGSWDIAENHRLQAALTYKRDDHRGLQGNITNDEVREVIHVNEDTWSAGFEYAVNPLRPLTIRAGLGFDALVPLEYWNEENEFLTLMEAGYFIVKTHNMFLFTWQTGAFYKITEDHELRLTYARKNHFPTMSDRYSTRFGSTLPNPNLGPEKANHFELGYRGDFFRELFDDSFLRVNTAFYYSIMEGKIVTVQLPNPHYPSALVDYSRNLDSVGFWGLELSPELTVKDWLSTGLTFSWNNYTLYHSQAGIKVMTYFPPITLNGYMVIKPVKFLSLIPRLEYISRRWSDTEGTMELDGYFLAHFKVSARIGSHWSVSLGVENIFDTYYEIRLNSPLAGRSFNLSALLAY